jgi:hypothetical protein
LMAGVLCVTVVIHHEVDVQHGGHVGFEGAKELQELRAAVAPAQVSR